MLTEELVNGILAPVFHVSVSYHFLTDALKYLGKIHVQKYVCVRLYVHIIVYTHTHTHTTDSWQTDQELD